MSIMYLQENNRDAFITPSKAWLGDGLLGCELSMGSKYTIPIPKNILDDIKKNKPKGWAGLIRGWTASKREDRTNYRNKNNEMYLRKSMPLSKV